MGIILFEEKIRSKLCKTFFIKILHSKVKLHLLRIGMAVAEYLEQITSDKTIKQKHESTMDGMAGSKPSLAQNNPSLGRLEACFPACFPKNVRLLRNPFSTQHSNNFVSMI